MPGECLYQYYVSLGICPRCKNADLAKGLKNCLACHKKKMAYWSARSQAFAAKGLCRRCGGAKEAPSKAHCNKCADYYNKAGRKTRLKRKEAGLCISCGMELPFDREGYSQCVSCEAGSSARSNKVRERRTALGLCRRCGGEISEDRKGKTECLRCSKKAVVELRKRRRRKKREAQRKIAEQARLHSTRGPGRPRES